MGIHIIHQELNLIPDLSVAENIQIGRDFPLKKSGLVDWDKVYSDATQIIKSLNLNIGVKTKLKELSVANQQMVEIAKVLAHNNPKIIIMDEPTAAISKKEISATGEF